MTTTKFVAWVRQRSRLVLVMLVVGAVVGGVAYVAMPSRATDYTFGTVNESEGTIVDAGNKNAADDSYAQLVEGDSTEDDNTSVDDETVTTGTTGGALANLDADDESYRTLQEANTAGTPYIDYLYPNGDVQTEWTDYPDASSYEAVDETTEGSDGDTSYIFTNTNDHEDRYSLADLGDPGAGYTLDNYVAMLEEFIRVRGLGRVTLVGNCMGCAISLAFTERHPDSVKALVLCNPLTESTFLGGWLGPLLWLRERLPAVNRGVYRVLGKIRLPGGVGPVATLFQLGPRGRARKVHRNREVSGCYSATGQLESLLGVLDDLENYAVIDRLAPREGFPPVCTIWGGKNKIVSPKAGRRLNATLNPARPTASTSTWSSSIWRCCCGTSGVDSTRRLICSWVAFVNSPWWRRFSNSSPWVGLR